MFKLTKQSAVNFPDGQNIPDNETVKTLVTRAKDENVPITIGYQWDWKTVDILIGYASALRYHDVQFDVAIPYMFGSRADRKFHEYEPHYFRDVIAPIINGLGARYIFTVDPHSDVVEACIPNIKVVSRKFLVATAIGHVKQQYGDNTKIALVVPDGGAIKKSYEISNMFSDVFYASKHRDIKTGALMDARIDRADDLDEKTFYLVVDDICDGGGTFMNLSKVINDHVRMNTGKDAQLGLYVTHGIFSKGLESLLTRFSLIVTTDSVNWNYHTEYNFKVVNVENSIIHKKYGHK